MTPQNNDPLISLVLQSYQILGLLGSGAVADVYKAQDVNTGQWVAIKIMQTRWLPFPHVMPRFEAEAQLLFSLQHPQIIRAFPPLGHADAVQGRPYFVMEYLAGGSFSEYLRGGGILTFGQAAEFIAQIAGALHYAHRQGIVHRDLKPANILLREPLVPQSAVLTDFGVAKMIYQSQMTNLVNQPGTPEYMAPEQFQAQEATPFSDQYALGVIMYWMLTRRMPFSVNDPMPIALQHLNVTPPPPSYLNPEVPPALDRVVMQTLSKDPYRRYQDMSQLAYAFLQAVHISSMETVPINAVSGSRAVTPQGYGASTGTLRLPGPPEVDGAGPGMISAQGQSTPLGAMDSPTPSYRAGPGAIPPARVPTYALLGVGGIAVLILGTLLGLWLALRSPVVSTPTAVVIAATDTAIPPTSTLHPTRTPTRSITATAGLTATKPLSITLPFTRTPTQDVTASSTPSETFTPTATSTETPTETPTLTATSTATLTPSLTWTPTATLPATATPTPLPPSLDEMLTIFNSELGTTLTFNCQRFIETYDALRTALDQDDPAYERARVLVDEPDDYAIQIYESYCQNQPLEIAARIDGMLYSRFRSQIRQLMNS